MENSVLNNPMVNIVGETSQMIERIDEENIYSSSF
jgi:hypothetical protein